VPSHALNFDTLLFPRLVTQIFAPFERNELRLPSNPERADIYSVPGGLSRQADSLSLSLRVV
jgi:hypothetical protein